MRTVVGIHTRVVCKDVESYTSNPTRKGRQRVKAIPPAPLSSSRCQRGRKKGVWGECWRLGTHTHTHTSTSAHGGLCQYILLHANLASFHHGFLIGWSVSRDRELSVDWLAAGRKMWDGGEEALMCVCVCKRVGDSGCILFKWIYHFRYSNGKGKKEETAFRGGWGWVHCAWGTSPSYGHFLLPALTHTRSLVRYIRPSINCICMGGVSSVCLCVCSTLGFLLCSYFFWMAFITNRMCVFYVCCVCVCVTVCSCVCVCAAHTHHLQGLLLYCF